MSETSQNPNQSVDVTALISNLLSNPESLSKIGSVLSKYISQDNGINSPPSNQNSNILATQDEEDNTNNDNISNNPPTEQVFNNAQFPLDLSKIASLFGGGDNASKAQNKEQIALLSAIRPYLSPRRQELIDHFIKFSNLRVFLNKINTNGGANVL